MRRLAITILGISIYLVLILAGALLYVEPLDCHWPHEGDTPMYRMENTEQWVCVSGEPGLYGWCSEAGLEEPHEENDLR